MSSNAIQTGLLSELSYANKNAAKPKTNELGQDAFLRLMVTQMENQNPLDPQENSEFVAQLAQFSSVEGLEKLNATVESMAGSFQSSQALQASSMVGRIVKVPSEKTAGGQGIPVAGTASLPFSSSNVTINIYDKANQLVTQEVLGKQAAGDVDFIWDGTDSSGATLPTGVYRFEVLATQGNGKVEQLGTSLSANVNSVTIGGNGVVTLNVEGVGPVSMSKVTEIL
jgi:flagellar basal-body rod modification protein FlgD